MNIIWISANRLGYELLKETIKIDGIKVNSIITLKDKAKTHMYDKVSNNKWKKIGIPVIETERIEYEIDHIQKNAPDIIVLCGWRQMIPETLLNLPGTEWIGFHPSLLPIGRGPAPIINTILEGHQTSGLSLFYLDKEVDSGDIIDQVKFVVTKNDYSNDIYNKCITAGKIIVRRSFPLLISGKIKRVTQDNSKATYFKKRTLKDNEIKLDKDTLDMVDKKIRAFSKPYLGAYIKVNNKKLVIWNAEIKDRLRE